MIDATLAAATQLRVRVRAAGVEGVPGVRVRSAATRGAEHFELVVEDRRLLGDEVYESRGLRFYFDPETASKLKDATLDLAGQDFVFKRGLQASSL